MASDSNITDELDSPHSPSLKIVAALFVGGFLFVILLPALLSLADSASSLDPADAFQQLTGWQLPPDARIVENSDTHGGMTNDGDCVLTVRLRPHQLQALLNRDSQPWVDCPVDPDIIRSARGIPDHSGKQYYAKKTFDSDSDWHRGHIVIANPDTGYIWIYEWKG